MVPNFAPWLTDFRTVFVFALGKMAKMAIYGHLAIGPCATNSGKWGIPEKSYKNHPISQVEMHPQKTARMKIQFN